MLFVSKSYSLIQHLVEYQLTRIPLNRLRDVLFQEPESEGRGLGLIAEVPDCISLRGVAFQYTPDSPKIIRDMTIEIRAGEKVVIVGPSGCGKSTLLKIMMGLLQPTSGALYLGDFTLQDIGMRHYRSLTASVMQDDALLSGSILDNIVFFDEVVDLQQVYDVASIACIHETIQQFPLRYETKVGDMGSSLSGGQKQRILLARALYKRPRWLFLDEASSHLDVDNERQINQALRSLSITQIIVAHRQETINMADRVITLPS
jgi:ATP-binding cassette subfamily B protein RaxB